MSNVITSIVPTTEVEAVNTMLEAVGEAPLTAATDLAAQTRQDIVVAIDVLRKVAREVLSEGWRFNTEDGVEIAPTTTYSWVDTDGTTTSLNIFKKPTTALHWEQTLCPENAELDLVERLSKGYVETALPVLVLYDRAKNRDGAEASRYPHIYLDIVSSVDFINMPECAREFIAIRAARIYVQKMTPSEPIVNLTARDELVSLRKLKRKEGKPKKLNVLNTAQAYAMGGNRPRAYSGASVRVFPGKA